MAVEARLLPVPSEDAMFGLLSALNNSGLHPELACSWATGGGAFLAGLTEPDAGHVAYTHTEADSGHEHCCDCVDHSPRDCDHATWKPPYPVVALMAEWPDADRAREDEIETWWLNTPTDLAPESDTEPTCGSYGCTRYPGVKSERYGGYLCAEHATSGPTAAPAPVPDDAALAAWLHGYGLCHEIAHYAFEHETNPPSAPCWVFARAVLASDWLAQHTAAAVDAALAQQREGLAQAIEALSPFECKDAKYGCRCHFIDPAEVARVVREFGEGR